MKLCAGILFAAAMLFTLLMVTPASAHTTPDSAGDTPAVGNNATALGNCLDAGGTAKPRTR